MSRKGRGFRVRLFLSCGFAGVRGRGPARGAWIRIGLLSAPSVIQGFHGDSVSLCSR